MTVRELINELLEFDPDRNIDVIVDCKKEEMLAFLAEDADLYNRVDINFVDHDGGDVEIHLEEITC